MTHGLVDITTESLKKDFGLDVPEIYVVMAKHSVMGMDTESIREILGCDAEDVLEVEKDESYKAVRTIVASKYAALLANQTAGWDQVEGIALNKLLERLPYEKDSEFLLKAATLANRAQRKHQKATGVLDPGIRNGRTVITLTQRLTQRLTERGGREVTETRELSISDGSMQNPTFDEVDSLLSVSTRPALPKAVEVRTHMADPDFDELNRFMASKE